MTLPEEKESINQEIESGRKYTERKLRAEMKDSLAEMEKRMLLRQRVKQNCRLCHVFETQRGIYQENLLSPPPTDLERLWHEGNHGDYLPNDPSRGLPGLSPAVNWGEFEKTG
jgi:hypothetical protein